MTKEVFISEESQAEIEAMQVRRDFIAPVIARGADHEQFSKDKRFVRLVEEGYFRDESLRLVELLTDSSTASADGQAALNRRLCGISAFKTYMRETIAAGRAAKAEDAQLEILIKQLESGKTIEDVLNENSDELVNTQESYVE